MFKLPLFFCLIVVVLGLSPHPGALIRLSTAAVDNAVKSIVDVLNEHIQEVQIPDQSEKKHHIHLEARDIKLERFNIDRNTVGVNTNTDNTVSFIAQHIEFKVSFHYQVKRKHLFSKSGHCSISVGDGHVASSLRLTADNGHPVISLLSKDAGMGDLHYKCHGDLIDHIINWLSGIIKPKIKKAIDDAIEKAIEQAFPKINEKLVQIPTDRPLSSSLAAFHVDYSIYDQPSTTPQMTRISVLSQFYLDGHKDDNPPSVFPSPGAFPDGPPERDICLNVDSNLVFKSAAYAFLTSDKSTFHLDKPVFGRLPENKRKFFDCDCAGELCLITLLPSLKSICKPGETVDIHGTVKLGVDIIADDRGLIISAQTDSIFQLGPVPGQGVTLLNLNAAVGVLLEKTVHIQDWSLFGHVSVFQTHLSATTPLGAIAPEIVQKIWEFALADLAELVINEALGGGIPLPPLKFITFDQVDIKFTGPLVQVCSNVNIDFSKLIHL
uniref:BPI1 domain-containing protein n=1 Tax=Panagrellus redivivus TaxID=6233 RepID=A0A7E4VVQ1_PANRE